MKPWLEEDQKSFHKKRPKRASNRPGEGMRVINMQVEEDYDDVEFDEDETFYYNTKDEQS